MSNKDKNTIEEDDILENIEEEIEKMEKDEESEKPSEASQSPEVDKTKDILTKTLADFDNYKKRVERDKKDMIFFLKSDILKKILPRVDDLERIIKNTPKDFQENIVFEWVVSLHKKLLQDLESLWVVPFDSIWKQVDPEFHDVMTVAPGWESGIIFDEFEKWYLLEWKVLRHAKVIVWT